jgi:glycosyltransferase involved in cell wall biosynthesis
VSTTGLPVAVDLTPLLTTRTGIARSVDELVKGLTALPDGPRIVPYALGARSRQLSGAPADTRFVTIPTQALLRAWSYTDLPKIDRWVGDVRVVHATNFLVPPSRRPTLVTVHDCSFALFPETVNAVVARFGTILRRAVRRGVVVHVTTEHVAGEVEQLYGPGLRERGQLEVVPFAVPELGPPATMPAALRGRVGEAPYVLALGTLEKRKNLAALVTAFGAGAAAQPDVRLVLAGPDGSARADVDAAVAALAPAVRGRVVLVGPVDDHGRRALMEEATLLAYPSLYEGFGFPVLEAMTLGVPVLASDIGALAEVAGDAAALVDPRDPDALAGALQALLTDTGRRRALVERGRERVRRYSWERTARGLAAAYARLAG